MRNVLFSNQFAKLEKNALVSLITAIQNISTFQCNHPPSDTINANMHWIMEHIPVRIEALIFTRMD